MQLMGEGSRRLRFACDAMLGGLARWLFRTPWLLGVLGLTAGLPFFSVLPWCAFMVVLSVIPIVGPFLGLFFAEL